MTDSNYPKLFITDLDGTALGGGHRPYARLPSEFASFLQELKNNGCNWATCTTWEHQAQLGLIQNSSEAPHPDYVVIGSGYAIAKPDADAAKLHMLEPYSAQTAKQVEELLQQKQGFRRWMREAFQTFDCRHSSFNGYWFAMIVAERETAAMVQFTKAIRESCPALHVECVEAESRFYMHPKLLSKGRAVSELLRITGLNPDQVVVAGDERMDLSMMTADLSAYTICPANAHPDVRQRVAERGGAIGRDAYGKGVIDAFRQLAAVRGWHNI